jgi:hypothetical protein
MAASSKRAAAASQGFFSFASDMGADEVRAAISSLRFHYASSWAVRPNKKEEWPPMNADEHG